MYWNKFSLPKIFTNQQSMLKKLKWLESNIWKIWIYIFTNRRAYMPLLGIYFLTFPDNTVKQIGIYTMLGSLFSFLFEIPSGYFSDRFGHKKTLILSKVFMILASISFLFGNNVFHFSLGSIFISLGFAFTSGTITAFMHEVLVELKKENLFTKIVGRNAGSVSLFNALLIIAIPFLTKINFHRPFIVGLIIDVIWLVVAFSFINTKKDEEIKKPKSFISVIKETRGGTFWWMAFFLMILSTGVMSTNSFRWPYLQSIWYPVAYIGFVMGLSRVVRFLVSRIIHLIEENISIKKLVLLEIFLFSGVMWWIAFIPNPYVVWAIMSLIIGYYWGREPIYKNYLIKSLPDKKYIATVLSTKAQITSLMILFLVFILGYIMDFSYHIGFLFLAIFLLIGLSISYFFIKKLR